MQGPGETWGSKFFKLIFVYNKGKTYDKTKEGKVMLRVNKFLAIVLLFFAFNIASCGGGGGGEGTPPPITNESASGIWEGTFFSNVTKHTHQVIGIITETGEARFIVDSRGQYSGNINVSGDVVTGTLRAYAPIGYIFPDGSIVGNVSVTGKVKTKVSLSVTYAGVGDSGSFTLIYNSRYERDSSLALISGTWAMSDAGYILTFTVNDNGTFTGSDSDGCVYNGTVSIINADYNAYRMNLVVSSCGIFNGSYSGLATVSDYASPSDTLIFGVSNQNLSVTGALRNRLKRLIGITELHPMNEARTLFGAARADGKIYAFGGVRADGYGFSGVECYDSNTDSWINLQSMPGPKGWHRAVTAPDGKIYLFGGSNNGSPSKDVWAYNPVTNSWNTSIPQMPVEERDTVAVLGNDGIIYLFGGYWNYSTVQAYNPSTKTWKMKSSMPTGRWAAAGALGPDGKIYIVGGGCPGQPDWCVYNTLEVYDPVTDSWKTKTPMPTARNYLGAAFGADGILYAIGGEIYGGGRTGIVYSVIEAYDPLTDTWEVAGNLPHELTLISGSVVTDNSGNIHILGGNTQHETINLHYLLTINPPKR